MHSQPFAQILVLCARGYAEKVGEFLEVIARISGISGAVRNPVAMKAVGPVSGSDAQVLSAHLVVTPTTL